MDKHLPKKLKILFWDFNLEQINISQHKAFIIERLLEKGDFEAVKWIFQNLPKQEVETVILKSPNISQKTRNFWQIVLNEKTT